MDDTDKAHTNLPSTHFRIQEEKIFIVIIMMLTKFDVCERRWKKVSQMSMMWKWSDISWNPS